MHGFGLCFRSVFHLHSQETQSVATSEEKTCDSVKNSEFNLESIGDVPRTVKEIKQKLQDWSKSGESSHNSETTPQNFEKKI